MTDYLLVTFNYKEGAEQITFDQIERSDLSSLGGPDRRFQAFGFGTGGFLFGVWEKGKGRLCGLPFLRFQGPFAVDRQTFLSEAFRGFLGPFRGCERMLRPMSAILGP